MDDIGYRARRRAAKTDAYYVTPQKDSQGNWIPVETVTPVNEPFTESGKSMHVEVDGQQPGGASIEVPPVKPDSYGFAVPGYRPPAAMAPQQIPGPTAEIATAQGVTTHPGVPKDEAAGISPVVRMTPHLQFMCGPLLRYDTVDAKKIWRGACLIVTADVGSQYDPHPALTLRWDAERPSHVPPGTQYQPGPQAQKVVVPGQEIFIYHGIGGSFTFWRFLIEVPLGPNEMGVRYQVNNGQEIEFFVPGVNQNLRMAAYSCNGFSAGVDPDSFKGEGFDNGFDPVWDDLLDKHIEKPFHVLIGGGDQLYCDPITREPELQDWLNCKDPSIKEKLPLADEIKFAIDRFYFSHYCLVFRNGCFAKANSSIPMLNMLDDHDLIDGFGSYPDAWMRSPIFNHIGGRGYFWYLLFQLFTVDEIDGTLVTAGNHTFKSTILGGEGPYIPSVGHSILSYMGPKVYILLIDCRAERKKDTVVSQISYDRIFEQLKAMPTGVEHLIIQLGIPIAYPRMNFLEKALDSKLNPIVMLGKTGSVKMGMAGFLNKFNHDAELLDDLSDHWTASEHKKERNWLIERVQEIALARHLRISFLSGDVHCAAVGCFKTLTKGSRIKNTNTDSDHRYMINVVTSAIVNTPPPNAVVTMVNMLADKTHKTMHHVQTDETMIPLFANDTNGQPNKAKFIMGKRNWCLISYIDQSAELEFDVRVEREKGKGETVGYPVRAPAPRWA